MSTVTKSYVDLVCDHPGCKTTLSEYSDTGYNDEQDAREAAENYDWQHIPATEDGTPARDLCPTHRTDIQEDDI